MRKQHFIVFSVFLLLSAIVLTSCNMRINSSIHIKDGRTVHSSLNTVNGNIYIGSDCKILGNCRTVNGVIQVQDNNELKELQTVNGRIEIGKNNKIRRGIKSVNGSVMCEQGTQILRGIVTVNGSIDLTNTVVRHDLHTYNGSITLNNGSSIGKDIIVKRNKGGSTQNRVLKIEIRDKSVVEGNIEVRDDDIEVQVYLKDGGKVKGKIKNAEVFEEDI